MRTLPRPRHEHSFKPHSSDEGGGGRVGARRYAKEGLSDDEFERAMESELMCVMKTMASPSALVATQPGRKGEAVYVRVVYLG